MTDDPAAGSFSTLDHEHDAVARMDLAEVFRTLGTRWKLISAITITFTLLAIAFAYHLSSYFVATTQILIDPEGSRYVEGELSTGQRATEAHALNQQFILTSAKVLSQVVRVENLSEDPEFGAGAPYDPRPEVRSQRALEALQKVVVAALNKASFVVNLSVTSGDPTKAARIANGIADTYVQTRASMNNEVVRQATSDLSSQLASLEQKVVEGDRAIQAFKVSHSLVDVDGRPTVEKQISETNTEISRISASIAENDAVVSELAHARSDKDYFRLMLDSYLTPTIVNLRARYHEAVEQQSVLESSLGSRHPLLQTANAKARSALALLDEQLANLGLSLSRNSERLKNQRALLQKNLTTLQTSLNTDGRSMVELRELERQLASDRLVYESFLLRTRQLTGQEQTISENPQIISVAQPPLEKAGPKRSLIVAGATVLGFLIGSGIAIGRQRSTTRGGPLPDNVRIENDNDSQTFPHRHSHHASRVDELLKGAGKRNNYCVVIYSSPFAQEPHRMVFEIAQSAAERGKDVLLVDAASNTALTLETATENCAGLQNSVSVRRIDCDLIEVPNAPRLRIMPAGFKTPRISTRRSTGPENLVAWLKASKLFFDLVIVDGGRMDEKRAFPEIEQAADKFVILPAETDYEKQPPATWDRVRHAFFPARKNG